jgi:hypothetical protein
VKNLEKLTFYLSSNYEDSQKGEYGCKEQEFWAWWPVPITPALGRMRQEGCMGNFVVSWFSSIAGYLCLVQVFSIMVVDG